MRKQTFRKELLLSLLSYKKNVEQFKRKWESIRFSYFSVRDGFHAFVVVFFFCVRSGDQNRPEDGEDGPMRGVGGGGGKNERIF